ncbi:MAG TPA: radical SAM protein, partial [Polyangiaceae bacterium]
LAEVGLALLKNYRPEHAPPGYSFADLVRQFVSQIGARGKRIGEFEWRFLFVAGMWFQDLFNYDFRRTEMCIIPYGTQMGEISFCAYNTGVGFRQIIESMKRTATVAEWFKTHGKHPVYAKNKDFPLPPGRPDVIVRDELGTGRRRLPLV